MKNIVVIGISILSVFILCSLSYQPIVAEENISIQNQINNNISIEINGGIGVTIEIHNNGNDIIPLINHTITVDSPFLFLGYSVSSNYSELMPGTSLSVWTGVIGFGALSVIVSIDDLIKSRDGYIFGPFVIFKIINSIGDNNER